MIVELPTEHDGVVEFRVHSTTADTTSLVWAKGENLVAPTTGDMGLTASLLPNMHRGEPLSVEGTVDSGLLESTEEIQAIFSTWDRTRHVEAPWYHRTPVEVQGVRPQTINSSGPGQVATFFTGGVDSFYTLLKHLDHIDAVVYVHGFDLSLQDLPRRREVTERLGLITKSLGVELLELESNLQAYGDEHGIGWPDYHGAALAAIAHLLNNRFGTVLIPATHTYSHMQGLGSHPLLDRLWSNSTLKIVHDGADATRMDKLRFLADHPIAREHLRVCWANLDPQRTYNCGRCEKCIRTGVAVRVAGLDGQFPTIISPSLKEVIQVPDIGRGIYWSMMRDELVASGANKKLRAALDLVIARRQLKVWKWTSRITP